jgi:hypothetical protein
MLKEEVAEDHGPQTAPKHLTVPAGSLMIVDC